VRVRHTAKPLPRSFSGHPAAGGLVAESDIAITPRGRLRAKLLVFEHPKSLRRFWKEALGKGDLGRGCLGAVTALAQEVRFLDGKRFACVDPRYFCVIGLTLGNLSMEVITHECVHAGFAFAKRHAKDYWVSQSDDYDEEDVCYPTGRLARRINTFLHDNGLYSK
jgi:hypothetical protein